MEISAYSSKYETNLHYIAVSAVEDLEYILKNIPGNQAKLNGREAVVYCGQKYRGMFVDLVELQEGKAVAVVDYDECPISELIEDDPTLAARIICALADSGKY